MKALSIVVALLLTAGVTKAQLANTKWQGSMMVPDAMQVILHFKADSVDMIIAENGAVGESMTYSVKDSVITIKKVDGHSPCDMSDVGKVKFSIRGDKLIITNISDQCDARAQAWMTEPFIRVKE